MKLLRSSQHYWFALALMMVIGSMTNLAVKATVPDSWQRGLAYTAWWHDLYLTPESDQSLELLDSTGANWISLLVTCYQNKLSSTRIDCPTRSLTPTDASLVHAIQKAKNLGLKVMLKPHLDLRNDPSHWRGEINFGKNRAAWNRWFRSYRKFILHYAQLAQANGVDQFSVGTELEGTTQRESDWRQIIQAVRAVYFGSLTYAANHGGEEVSIQFWDTLDLIGVDAYVALTDKTNPTLDELKAGWVDYLGTLQSLSERWGKFIIFTELGYRSLDGANMAPWDWQIDGAVDLQEQADCYQAFFESFQNQSWMHGVFWWNWASDPDQGGTSDTGYTPYGKPAERVLSAFYGGSVNKPTSFRVIAQRSNDSIRFVLTGGKIKSFQVHVFALNGSLVFKSDRQRREWAWNLRDLSDREIAHGVYLYVIAVYGVQGEVIMSKLQKVVVP